MDKSTTLNIATACIGLMAGLWLAWGTASTSASRIWATGNPSWTAYKENVPALIKQASQHTAGAILLVVTFVLQLYAATTSPNPAAPPFLSVGHLPFAGFCLLVSLAFGGLIFRWRESRLRKELEPRIEQQDKDLRR